MWYDLEKILLLYNWRRTTVRCYFAFDSWSECLSHLPELKIIIDSSALKAMPLNHLSLFPLLWKDTGIWRQVVLSSMKTCIEVVIIHAQAHLSNIFTKPKWTEHFYTKCNFFLPPYVHRLFSRLSDQSHIHWSGSLKWGIQKVNKVKEV